MATYEELAARLRARAELLTRQRDALQEKIDKLEKVRDEIDHQIRHSLIAASAYDQLEPLPQEQGGGS